MKEFSPVIGPEIYKVADFKTSEDLNIQLNVQSADPLVTPGLEELQSPLVHGAKDKSTVKWEHNAEGGQSWAGRLLNSVFGVNNDEFEAVAATQKALDDRARHETFAGDVYDRNSILLQDAGGRLSQIGDNGHQLLSSLTKDQVRELGEAMARGDKKTQLAIWKQAQRQIDGHHAVPPYEEARYQQHKREEESEVTIDWEIIQNHSNERNRIDRLTAKNIKSAIESGDEEWIDRMTKGDAGLNQYAKGLMNQRNR